MELFFKCCSDTNNPGEKIEYALGRLLGGIQKRCMAVLPSRFTVQSHLIGHLVSVLSGVHCIPRIGVRFFLPWESRSEKKTACGSWSVGDMLLSSVQCWASAGERCSRAFSLLQQAITRRLDLGLRDLQRRYRFDGGMFRDICWD